MMCNCLNNYNYFGGYSGEVTPVPIPNTEVKLFCADGTARATVWESRTPPEFNNKTPFIMDEGGFVIIRMWYTVL